MAKGTSSNQSSEKSSKKVYKSPKVRSYGNVREITKATGGAGKRDNPFRNTKTSL